MPGAFRRDPRRRAPGPRAARRPDPDDGVLPLINVVFLLLVFFMVAGRLAASDPFELLPPRSASEGRPPEAPALLAIGPAGELALDGEVLAEPALLARLAASGAREIRVKADGRAGAARVVALLDRLRGAGIGTVRLLAVAEAGG